MQVVWSSESLKRVLSIREYLLKEWSEKEVNIFLNRLRDFESRVKQYPNLYPASDKFPALRKAVISKHQSVIYEFEIDRKIIMIHTILDHRQQNII